MQIVVQSFVSERGDGDHLGCSASDGSGYSKRSLNNVSDRNMGLGSNISGHLYNDMGQFLNDGDDKDVIDYPSGSDRVY